MNAKPLPEEDIRHVLREANGVWEELRGKRIFLTGATGFFGRWMLESLFAADLQFELGVTVVALSRDPEKFLRMNPHLEGLPGLTWLRGSVVTLEPDAVAGTRFDHVIHLATEGDLVATGADPGAAADVIAGGTRRALELASRTGARKFLFTSSGAVYGPQPPGLDFFSESHPTISGSRDRPDARTVGAMAKLQAEQLCAKFGARPDNFAVIARCFAFAGPGQPLEGKFAFGNFMRDAVAGRQITITGDGTPVRSYLHAADLTVWLWILLVRGRSRIYNVGSEHAVCLRDLAEMMALELRAPGVEVRGKPEPGQPANRYVPLTERARKELGLRELVGLKETIRRTADWLRH